MDIVTKAERYIQDHLSVATFSAIKELLEMTVLVEQIKLIRRTKQCESLQETSKKFET